MSAPEAPHAGSRFHSVAPLLTGILLLVAAIGIAVVTSNLTVSVIGTALLFALAGFLFGQSREFPRWLTALFLYLPLVLTSLLFLMGNWVAYALPVAVIVVTHAGIRARQAFSARRFPELLALTAGSIAFIALVSLVALPFLSDLTMNARPDEPLPNVTYTTPDGRSFAVSSLRGKVVLINYWASWCSPCREEFPELQRLFDRYKNNPDVLILAVNTGWKGETPEKASRFIEAGPYTVPYAFDNEDTSKDSLRIFSIPVSLVVDRQGIIRFRRTGYIAEGRPFADIMAAEIEPLLKE